jgi:hypothetical protein
LFGVVCLSANGRADFADAVVGLGDSFLDALYSPDSVLDGVGSGLDFGVCLPDRLNDLSGLLLYVSDDLGNVTCRILCFLGKSFDLVCDNRKAGPASALRL